MHGAPGDSGRNGAAGCGGGAFAGDEERFPSLSLHARRAEAPLSLPAAARLEVSDIGWYALADLRRADWRFAYQFDLFLEVARQAMQSSSGSQEGDASAGRQAK